MFTARTLGEGWLPLTVLALFTAATGLFCPVRWAVVLPAALLLFTIWFFRDPVRRGPADPALVVAPGDGRVVEIRPATEPQFVQGDTIMVAIFLSVFDVHVQRAPVTGTIRRVLYQPGRFLDARHPQAGAQNESRLIGIETADGRRVSVRQIAGLIARRVVGWAGEGAAVARGDRLGLIRFGSRVELYLPPSMTVTVKLGEPVRGGETVLARP